MTKETRAGVLLEAAGLKALDASFAEEVLDVRVDGDRISNHIDDFLTKFIADGQQLFDRFDRARKEVEDRSSDSGRYLDDKDLQSAVSKHMRRSPFGNEDEMAKLFVRMIVNKEFID